MIRRTLLILALLVVPVPVLAQEIAAGARTHTVERGETLWDLARRYFGNPFDWRTIWEANQSKIEDPHWIYPGQVFQIPGQSRLVTQVAVETGEAPAPAEAAAAPRPPEPARPVSQAAGPMPGPSDRTVFYPTEERVESRVLDSEAMDLYFVTPDLFQSTGWIDPTSSSVPEHLGVIDDFQAGENLRSGRTAVMPHDLIRVGIRSGSAPEVGTELTTFRIRDRVNDVGLVAVPTGMITVVGVEDSIFVAELSNEFDQVALGDYVVHADEFPLERSDRPTDLASPGMEATVVAFQVPNQLNSRGTILFLDKGAVDGVKTGDVFELRLGAGDGWSGKVAGTLLVHRVRENTAAARVMQVTNPVFFRGTMVRMVARMP